MGVGRSKMVFGGCWLARRGLLLIGSYQAACNADWYVGSAVPVSGLACDMG